MLEKLKEIKVTAQIARILVVQEADLPRVEPLLRTLLRGTAVLAASLFVVGTIDYLSTVIYQPVSPSTWASVALSPLLFAATLGLRKLSRRGYMAETANLLLAATTLYLTFVIPAGFLVAGPALIAYAIPITAAALLLTPDASLFWAAISTLAILLRLLLSLERDGPPSPFALRPSSIVASLLSLYLLAFLARLLARSLYDSHAALRRRFSKSRTGVEIGHIVTAAIDLPAVTRQAVKMIASTFGYYHVGLFVLDPEEEVATLIEAAGESARALKDKGVRLPLGGTTAVAAAINQKQPSKVTSWAEALDSRSRPIQFTYDRLPTRVELAIPLRVRNRVLGALDLHSTDLNAFPEEEIHILEGIAGNIANAFETTHLFDDIQRRHQELGTLYAQTERRSRYLATTADLARAISSLRDPQELLDQAVELISERFNFYHAGIFLTDETGGWAVLTAANSAGGKRMLARGHKLRVGEQGIVGRVTHTGQPRIALDVGEDAAHYAHSDLPDTRSEMALPLKVGDQLIGALDVQSVREGAFTDEDTAVLQTLTDQIAIAIENARLFQRTQQALEEMQILQRYYITEQWEQFSHHRPDLHAEYRSLGVPSLETPWTPEMAMVFNQEAPVILPDLSTPTPQGDGGDGHGEDRPSPLAARPSPHVSSALAVPITLRDEVIGVLDLHEMDEARHWTDADVTMATAVADQLGLALENARLFEDARARAEELVVLNELGQALTARPNVEQVLDETYRGASRLLNTTNFYIALYNPDEDEVTFALDVTEGELRKPHATRQAGRGLTEYVIRNRAPLLIGEDLPERLEDMAVELIGRVALSWLGVPLMIGDRVLGVVAVQSYTTPRAYDEHDQELLTAIGSQAAIALQNAYLFEETEAALAETEALFRIGEAISRLGSVEETLQTIANVLVEQLGYTSSWLALTPDQAKMLRGITQIGSPGQTVKDATGTQAQTLQGIASAGAGMTEDGILEQIPLDDQSHHPAVQAVLEGKKVVVNAVWDSELPREPGRDAPGGPSVPTVTAPGHSLADSEPRTARDGRTAHVPILVGAEVAGVISVNRSLSAPEFTDRDIERLAAVADQAAVALQNERLLRETQRRATQLAAAAEVARGATAILNVDALLDATVRLISEQFGFYHAGAFLLDEEGEYACLRAASSQGGRRMLERGHRLQVGKVGIVGNVAATGVPRIALDVGEDAFHFAHDDLPDTRSEMGLPLVVRGQVIGVLDVQSTEEAAFSEDDVATLQTMADQLASAIVNARLFQEARTEATRRALINEVQQAAVASLNPDELLHQAGEVISRRLQRPSALFAWEPEGSRDQPPGGSLRPVAIHDENGDDVFTPAGLQITRETSPFLFSEVIEGRRIRALDALAPSADASTRSPSVVFLAEQVGIETGIYIPLTGREQILGVLVLAQPNGRTRAAESGELDFLEIVGANLSVALENAQLYQDTLETAEKLKEIDQLKSQFLANMSHELRTPLNSIIGFSRVILKGIDGPLTDMQRTDLQAIHESGKHLLELINDILDISKIQAGKMELSFEDTDLGEIIRGVMSTAIALVKDKPVELQQSIPDDLPIIRIDSRRIRQVILNLVGNAAKFTEEGFIHIEAEAGPTEVVVSVADSGTGMPPEKLDTIFEAFSQVDGSTTRRAGGTGLGLSISREFVEMHGGRIWVESTSGVGSTFYIALPIAGPPESSEEEEGIEETEAGQAYRRAAGPSLLAPDQKVVLCVDDDEGVITLFRRYLGRQNYRIVGLTDSTAVTDHARRLKPFAITLDVIMPEKDGWQVIQELKTDPETRRIPVIMCTIVGEKGIDKGLSLGASDYLVKPILEDDLVAALERLDCGESHHTVLVVDDQAEDRNLLSRMIESQEGYQVVEAVDGKEAIAKIQQVQPDIIILDLMMPEVDGFAVLESVKADKKTRSIPIIVVTAKDLTQEDRDRLNMRVEALLQKGIFKQQELLADVAAALERIGIDRSRDAPAGRLYSKE